MAMSNLRTIGGISHTSAALSHLRRPSYTSTRDTTKTTSNDSDTTTTTSEASQASSRSSDPMAFLAESIKYYDTGNTFAVLMINVVRCVWVACVYVLCIDVRSISRSDISICEPYW